MFLLKFILTKSNRITIENVDYDKCRIIIGFYNILQKLFEHIQFIMNLDRSILQFQTMLVVTIFFILVLCGLFWGFIVWRMVK